MAGVITGLQFQQRDKERVNVYLDGEYAFGLVAVEAAGLRKGQELSDAEIAELKAGDLEQRMFDKAVRFLAYRPRSRKEVEHYLKGKQVGEEIASEVLARLERSGYLDDEMFARFWVENRMRFRPRGRRALDYELRQKGVSRPVIEGALEGIDDEEAAWQAIEAKLQRWKSLDDDQLRRKLSGYLQRRGFSYETVKVTIQKVRQALSED